MIRYAVAFVVTAMVFCALDAAWLGWIAVDFYRAQLDGLLRAPPDLMAAVLFYLLYITGMLVFVVVPNAMSGSWLRAVRWGALFGLFTYATYDLTNMATLRGWTWPLTVVDIGWGVVVTAIAASAGCVVLQRLMRWQQLVGARCQ